MKTWWSARSARTRAILAVVALLVLYGIFGPKSASSTSSSASPSAAAPVVAVATASPTPSPAPTFITGMTTADISGNAKAKGLSCGQPKAASAGGTALQIVDCLGTVGSGSGTYLLDVTYASADATHVRLMTVAITPTGSASLAALNDSAGVFLGFFATMPYTGAEPTKAQDWVKANAAKLGAMTTIGPAFFEIDATPSDINTRRLNVIAVGARP